MTDYTLRGVFYLGDLGDRDKMFAQGDQIMDHLLQLEELDRTVRDPAVSVDAEARTVEIELVVTAETMAQAHGLADAAVRLAFEQLATVVSERSVEMDVVDDRAIELARA